MITNILLILRFNTKIGLIQNLRNKTLQVLAPEGFKSRLPKGRNKKSEKGIKVSQRGSLLPKRGNLPPLPNHKFPT